ncbi:MAG TPA: DUF6152 family protein [Steroidobacteraceae bacterium]|jgi:hypothetical protein
MKLQIAIVAAGLVASVSGTAVAHHSFAMFDQGKQTKLVGVIKEVQWTNPHIWVQVLVKDSSGKDQEWSIEGGSPNGLSKQGWKRSSLKPGDQVELVIHPLKNGDKGGSLMHVSVDGKPVGVAGRPA